MTLPGREPVRRFFKRVLKWLLCAFGVSLLVVLVYAGYLYLTLPGIDHLEDENPTMTSYIRIWAEREGYDPNEYQIDSWTDYEDIAPLLVRATVYAEDTGFYGHDGVEWEMTRRMAVRYLEGRRATGASTIHQQLARNLFFSGDVSLSRKTREIMLAVQLDKKLSKERIVELYLNVIEFGEGVWGITKAAQHYFDKSPAELDAFECVYLPSILPAPRRALTGKNLYRASATWRRICYYLHAQDQMTLDEWVHAKRGIGALEIELKQGRPLFEALEVARSANDEAAEK